MRAVAAATLCGVLALGAARAAAEPQVGGPPPDQAQPAQPAQAAQAAPGLPAGSRLALRAPDTSLLLGQHSEIVVSGVEPGARLEVTLADDGVLTGEQSVETEAGDSRIHLPLRVTREGELHLDLTVVSGEKPHETRDPLPRVVLNVVLDVPVGHAPQVAAALPPLPVPMPPTPIWPFLAGIGAALLALFAYVVRAGRVLIVPPPPPRPADVLAAEELARLRSRLPRTRDEVPAFTVDVSDVLRTYIERRFGVRAPESTTEEFLSAAGGRAELSGHRGPLEGFLSTCDLVKFARHRPEPTAVVPLLDTAEGFVEATRT